MTLKQLLDKIEKETHYESPELRYRLIDFVNDAIQDFMDLKDWHYMRKFASFTTDNSDSYTIASIVGSDYYYGTYGKYPLIKDGVNDTEKYFRRVSYQEFKKANQTNVIWALENNVLYRTGTGEDLTLFYLTPGELYPMVAETDTNLITENYSDIIKKYAIVKFHLWEGDLEKAQVENNLLSQKIKLRMAKENRENKQGKMVRIGHSNR